MDDRIFVPDLLLVKLKSAVCNIESTQNSSKVNDTFSGLTIYGDVEIDSKQQGSLYNASPELLAAVNQQMGGRDGQRFLPFLFEKPLESEQVQDDQAALRFLDKQRRLNRYEVKAVSQLSKLYKSAYQ